MRGGDLGGALLAVALSTLLVLAMGEVAARLYYRHALSYDFEMWRYAEELKQPAADPRLGHVHRPSRSARLMGVEVATNAAGLRDRDYPRQRDAARRIVFLGDSLTLGWGVERRQTFEYLLEEALTAAEPTEVLNFGVGNYNTAQEVALLEDRGLAYSPDAVVVFYFINDAEPTPRRSRWSWLGHSRFLTFVWSRAKTLASRASAQRSFAAYYAALYAAGQPGWEESRRAFAELRDACRARGIGLGVVLLPELHQLSPYAFAAQHRLVAETLAALGVPALDLAPAFADQGEPRRLWVALDDAHPNALAHQLIADRALAFVTEVAHATP